MKAGVVNSRRARKPYPSKAKQSSAINIDNNKPVTLNLFQGRKGNRFKQSTLFSLFSFVLKRRNAKEKSETSTVPFAFSTKAHWELWLRKENPALVECNHPSFIISLP